MSKLQVDQVSKTSAGADTFVLPASDGTVGQLMKTDGAGQLGWATVTSDTNTPAWHVGINSVTQTIADATFTKVELDDVKFDTGFTWDTANYKGIPGTAGKYLIGCAANINPNVTGQINGGVYLYKNGVSQAFWGWQIAGNDFRNGNLGGTTILDLGATDYVEMFVYIDHNVSSVTLRQYDATQCITYMFGTKLIGA